MTFSTLASPGVSLQGGGGSGGGGGGTPGGSNTQIQYNSSGTFAGASGLTTNGTELTIASGTKTADAPVLNMSQTWNNAAVTFTGLKFNATDTASASGSLLLDLGTGGGTYVSKFSVSKSGDIITGGASTGSITTQAASFGNGLWHVSSVRGPTLISGGSLNWVASSTPSGGTIDTILTRRDAANLRLGAADAAAPVAQTLSVQSITGTNVSAAAYPFKITGAQGTGNAAGGSIIFQVAPAGGAGSAQNTPVDALTIASNKDATFGNDISCSGNMGLGGAIWSGNSSTTGYSNAGVGLINASGGLILGSSKYIAWVNAANLIGTQDLILARDAANTLALRNGTAAQTFRVYNTYTSDTNYESGRLQWVGNEWRIGPETVGGSNRSMGLYSGGTRYQIIGSSFNQFDQSIYMNGANITTDTSTGFKIGTGATQKIGFWNATPIAQPTTAVAAATVAATGVGDVVAASTTFDGYTIPQIVKAMRNAGLLA